ncbi:hypothetical protein ISF_07200 [Cordyceps fumosorosea ARSEF 2679]|uniref:Uncharacterized protein n=1 Tax=Cordyceps fumosorosea (strain ARSEF 2679) TaxID=1081104 RepID=A0A167Q4I0_CORFA|nr:hypothetical protein ISF_07200 [Cordyceps fumosorosea ARSEF 2679]OAA57279.1 hypothetical protein ISF_07200 [Cordyceps fumosorosea ARSEF 2679]
MDQNGEQDSPVSIAANIAGLLTFAFALAAAAYARVRYLRSSSTEYLRVKTSLSWYKTESTWLQHLVSTQGGPVAVPPRAGGDDDGNTDRSSSFDEKGSGKGEEWPRRRRVGLDRPPPPPAQRAEQHMFEFVMDDLLNLERRLLDMVNDVESRAAADPGVGEAGISWSLVPGTWHGGRPSVAVAWLGVRTKALELVRQREALTARVQFLQLSMIASRLQSLEVRVSAAEEQERERERERLLTREDTMVSALAAVRDGIDSGGKPAVERSGYTSLVR